MNLSVSGEDQQKQQRVRTVDFRLPRSFERSQLRGVEIILGSAMRPAGTLIGAALRRTVRIDVTGLDQLSWEAVLTDTSGHGLVLTFGLPPLGSRAVLFAPMEAALLMLDLRLGGTGVDDSYQEERQLTDLEQTLLAPIVADLAHQIATAISTQFPVSLERMHTEPSLEFIQGIPLQEMCVVVKMDAAIADTNPSTLTLVMPYSMLRPVVDLLSNRTTALPDVDDGFKQDLAERLLDVEVVARVRFRPTSISSQRLLELREGEVLNVGHRQGKPLSLMVDRVQVAQAVLGQSGSRVAAVIVEGEE